MMQSLTGEPAQLWGPSIVGFGSYHYRYASSREGDWFLTGFAPRKRDLVVYLMSGFAGADALLARLGPHRTGKSCLYIRRLEQIDFAVLEALVAGSIATLRRRHGGGGLSAQEPHTPS